MLLRIVRLTLRPEEVHHFREIFFETRPRILQFPGCQQVELFDDLDDPHVCYTHSYWDSAQDLDAYRSSDYFKGTWSRVKPLFGDKAQAFSLTRSPKLKRSESNDLYKR